jgi:iron complex outermembrane receptor protein
LSTTASAIQVIMGEDIRSSGATNLPEALRLASNLQVAQIDASRWAVSARGFNSVLANKLLVQIDGRSIYSPLFAGVFWSTQDVLLEDIDRIEVVSGPGGALWGANAVNGIINVRTKSARETPGLLVKAGMGEGLRTLTAVRYGGALSPDAHFRVYGKFAERDGNLLPGGREQGNWDSAQGGFRLDWNATKDDQITVQGDAYKNHSAEGLTNSIFRGGNIIGRWSRRLTPDSGLELQLYIDRVRRELPGSYFDRLDTYDIDFQHNCSPGGQHEIVWGAGYRQSRDDFESGRIVLLPRRESLETFHTFVQDEFALTKELRLTAGVKLERNHFTGWEVQPSIRAGWTPSDRQTWWAALSRAVRTPARLDRHRHIAPVLAGSPAFESEKLVAWEAGWRVVPASKVSFALAAFYHDYADIRSIEVAPPGTTATRVIGNGQAGRTYGVEGTAIYEVSSAWRIHAGITAMRVRIEPRPESADRSFGALESVDAERYYTLRSTWYLPRGFEVTAGLRHAGPLTNPSSNTPAYTDMDARISWHPVPRWELAVSAQNLFDRQHVEYGDSAIRFEVKRQVYATVKWGF